MSMFPHVSTQKVIFQRSINLDFHMRSRKASRQSPLIAPGGWRNSQFRMRARKRITSSAAWTNLRSLARTAEWRIASCATSPPGTCRLLDKATKYGKLRSRPMAAATSRPHFVHSASRPFLSRREGKSRWLLGGDFRRLDEIWGRAT